MVDATARLFQGTAAGRPVEVVPGTTSGNLVLVPGDDPRARIEAAVHAPAQDALGTGHPPGGNALSTRDDNGAVDGGFRVRHVPSLFVVDTSLFPASAGVNPSRR